MDLLLLFFRRSAPGELESCNRASQVWTRVERNVDTILCAQSSVCSHRVKMCAGSSQQIWILNMRSLLTDWQYNEHNFSLDFVQHCHCQHPQAIGNQICMHLIIWQSFNVNKIHTTYMDSSVPKYFVNWIQSLQFCPIYFVVFHYQSHLSRKVSEGMRWIEK